MSTDNRQELKDTLRLLQGGRDPEATEPTAKFPLSRTKGTDAYEAIIDRDGLPWSPRARRIGRGILIATGVVVAGATVGAALYAGTKVTEQSNDKTIEHSTETVQALSKAIQEHPERYSRLVVSEDMPAVPAVMEALDVPEEKHDAVEQLLTAQAISFDHSKPGHEGYVDGRLYQGETMYFPTADVPDPTVDIYTVNLDALSSQIGALPQNSK